MFCAPGKGPSCSTQRTHEGEGDSRRVLLVALSGVERWLAFASKVVPVRIHHDLVLGTLVLV